MMFRLKVRWMIVVFVSSGWLWLKLCQSLRDTVGRSSLLRL